MDNRIANDMISSGMIPSGEKKKEDLSRTQYGSAPSPNALLDAYKSMYDKKEEVINEHHKKDADGNTIPHEHEEELNEGKIPAGLQAYLDKKKGKKEDKKEMKEGLATAAKMALGLVKNMAKKKVVQDIGRGAATQLGAQAVGSMMNSGGGQQKPKTGTVSATQYASADLFDIVKGQLLDEGLTEEEIKDIMLTLTPDEILKEIEESSMSAGSSGGHYHDGGDGVFRSKEQIGNMFNKNIPTKKQTGGKVDKMTRKSINTSARELGIQGPTTLKQSVEPKGETI